MVLWDEIFAEVATNLHADILSDLAAARLIAAIENVTSAGEAMTPDLGGTATTEQVPDAVCEILVTAGT